MPIVAKNSCKIVKFQDVNMDYLIIMDCTGNINHPDK